MAGHELHKIIQRHKVKESEIVETKETTAKNRVVEFLLSALMTHSVQSSYSTVLTSVRDGRFETLFSDEPPEGPERTDPIDSTRPEGQPIIREPRDLRVGRHCRTRVSLRAVAEGNSCCNYMT